MAIFKSGNPALSEKHFEKTLHSAGDTGVMTEKGTLNKFGLLMILVLASASFTWKAAADGVNVLPWIIGTAIGGLVIALILAFKPVWASFLAPVYALVEGVFVGGISAYYNDAFSQIAPNIVMQAVGITFGVVIAMFGLYRFGVIKATQKFKA
ncbi:MAG: Bax inhibitor-1/YccA family membrane protein, partial [Flavitalea sp.]